MEQSQGKILTLDLWDTVIRRKCHPDEIKEKTSDYLLMNYYDQIREHYRSVGSLTRDRILCEQQIGQKSRSEGYDDEYEMHDVFRQWIENVFAFSQDADLLTEELYAFELQTEIDHTYLDPDIVSTVNSIPHDQLAYVSDFYAGKDFLDCILDHAACPLHFDRKYISCECRYNKRSGRLFDYVLEDLKIVPEQQFHMGDNAYSDVEIPAGKGINTKHYLPSAEHRLRTEKEKIYNEQRENENSPIDFKKAVLKDGISVFFYGFIHWIIESCIQDHTYEIYFFTREGEFYRQVFDEIVKNEYPDDCPLKAEVLEVSRLSTFCASLREISLNEMMRIWNQYSIQSIGALFKSLGIEKKDVEVFTERFGIPWDEVITYPWQDQRVISLFNDADFLCVLDGQRESKKEFLLKYLSQKGIDASGKKQIAIVDIGWRGTIQDNISYLLPDHLIKGYYVGLIPFLNEQPANTKKRGYLNGYKKFDLLLKYVMPFEMISNSPNGSTTGYEYADQRVCAVRKKEKEEDRIYYQYIERIQKAVLDDIAQISSVVSGRRYIANSMRGTAHDKLGDYILHPPRTVAAAYFSLKHNEEFGVGEYVDKTTVFRPDLFIKACFGRKHRSRLAQFLRDTTWPQGYLIKYHLEPLVGLYNQRYSEDGF